MHPTLRTLVYATALAATLAPVAFAGGMGASLQGPAKDGVTYTVMTYSCSGPKSMRPSGWAEGVVNGERRTLPLSLQPSKIAGGYVFQRTWPQDGHWLVRLTFANANAATLVARIGHNGRVADVNSVWNSDGKHECDTQLAAAVR